MSIKQGNGGDLCEEIIMYDYLWFYPASKQSNKKGETTMSEEKKEVVAGKGGKKNPPEIKPKEGTVVGTVNAGGQDVPVVEVEGKEPKKKAAKKVTKAGSLFIGLKEVGVNEKMPKQCVQIMAIINAAPEKTINREDLLAAMTPVITTRQPIERILGFYQSRMVAGNWVKIQSIVKVEEKKPEVQGDAPAPTVAGKPTDPAAIV